MCETREMGFKWPFWRTLAFSDVERTDMRYVCPSDVKKDAGAEGPINALEEVGKAWT